MAEMNSIRLRAAIDDLSPQAKGGAIWGTVYLTFDDGQAFPELGWSDMPVAVARAWLGALLRLSEGKIQREEVAFYDGPFKVEALAGKAGIVVLNFFHREKLVCSHQAELAVLVENALLIGQELMVACEDRGLRHADTGALAKLLDRAPRRDN